MTNQKLVELLILNGVLKTPKIIKAFLAVDRKDFVPDEYINQSYGDYPLPVGGSQTISQPTTVAIMLELLQPKSGEKILDLGSGSGWTTALVAQIIGRDGSIFGLEIIPKLVKFGAQNLKKYHFSQAKIQASGNELGLPKEAPFDRILVSAAANRLPEVLIDQLKVGGRLVMPIGGSVFKIDKISQAKINQQELPGFVFVPLKT